MEHLDGILKLVDNELESITKNGKFRSREEIESVGELIDMVKDIHCIWEYEDGAEYDMSYADGMSYERGGERGMRSYRGGQSYARGQRNARRDSMGRYSRDGYRGGVAYRGGYSSDGREDYIEHLHEMLETAPDENTRQGIQRMIQQLENQ